MDRRCMVAALAGLAAAGPASAQLPRLDEVLRKGSEALSGSSARGPGAGGGKATPAAGSVAGIKEALAVGTERAVASLGRPDGYLGNQAVKILLPSPVQKVAELARMAGYQKQVDEFVLSMNRAAEAAVPMASGFFADAIRDMTLDDARGILAGDDTAATRFFRGKTEGRLFEAFRPVVADKVGEAGVTRAYQNLMGRYGQMALPGAQSLDLNDYVTSKALDGLFHMVGEEERKIRSNPAARTTELLKQVFGG